MNCKKYHLNAEHCRVRGEVKLEKYILYKYVQVKNEQLSDHTSKYKELKTKTEFKETFQTLKLKLMFIRQAARKYIV